MKNIFFIVISLIQVIAFAKDDIRSLSLKDISYKAIEYALNNQVSSDGDRFYLRGEWPTQIESTLIPIIVGVGKPIGKDEEATAFTTGSVVNMLSQVYLDNQQFASEYPMNQIPQAIQNGVNTLSRYAEGSTFNFYPPLMIGDVKVRQPINMQLLPIWKGFTNIPNDADTSSVAISALIFNAKINKTNYLVSHDSLDTFSRFRDTERKPMFFNKREGVANTGGFMTWLFDENDPNMPHNYFAKPTAGVRIPFNRNDVDCIVNGNVLKMLALAKKADQPGHDQACQLINDMITTDSHATCGVYYPNTLNLSFTTATIEKAGETCITENSHRLIVDKILKLQSEDGSWQNDRNIWEDKTLTTAFAMYSLIHFGNPKETRVQASLIFGMHYLLSTMKQKDGAYYWNADHYFTATALARSLVMWSSKAYTNVLVSAVLLEMNRRLPSYKVKDYMMN